jgi:hypothetical protein
MNMSRVSAADVFLMVTIMSVAFLTEIALFILMRLIGRDRAGSDAKL